MNGGIDVGSYRFAKSASETKTMHRVGPKGNVVIEKELRERLGVTPGSESIQRLEGKRLVMEFIPPVRPGSAAGSLAKYFQSQPLPEGEEELNDLIDHHTRNEAYERDQESLAQ
jgi:bifunctional DNA-binding transcriptional regulator/antitoxin component of YhaV-PrlF toxin-antitoxin module